MPRANRHFLTGHLWHITHRCHQKQFLLKFARDRRRYLHWVFEAKKCFGLQVQSGEAYKLGEQREAYAGDFPSEKDALTLDNTIPWDEYVERTKTERGPTRSRLVALQLTPNSLFQWLRGAIVTAEISAPGDAQQCCLVRMSADLLTQQE